MTVKDQQVAVLVSELRQHGVLYRAAARAGMSEPTARKYVRLSKLPSDLPRRTRAANAGGKRPDPFAADAHVIEALLHRDPHTPVREVFEHVRSLRPGRYSDSQYRTLARRVREWREKHARTALPPRPTGRSTAAIVLDLYEALRGGPKSAAQLAKAVGVEHHDVARYVRELEKTGRAVNREAGSRVREVTYRLVRSGRSSKSSSRGDMDGGIVT